MSAEMPGLVASGCRLGKPGFSCKFCRASIHRGDSGCGCSTFRPTTAMASLCLTCADALDTLTADTTLGRVHAALVYAARMSGMHFDGDS